MPFADDLVELKRHLREVQDLRSAAAVLGWDQSTHMPPGGAAARGRQIATLGTLAHRALIAPEVGRLLDRLEPAVADRPVDDPDAALVRVTRYDLERALRVPAELLQVFEEHAAATYHVWTEARPANDFGRVADGLERTLELSRQVAERYPHEHIADPLIEEIDPGVTVAELRPLFARLREALTPLLSELARVPQQRGPLEQVFPRDAQLEVGLEFARAFGYDLERGRQDLTHHPFATSFGPSDVRITTRIDDGDLAESLFSTLHEAGHALYEQGIDAALDGTPLASGVSSGVHESQSRLWENLVGRSLPFWRWAFPRLQRRFPHELGGATLESTHRSVNRVTRGLIRTDADEVSYNLHVIVRFELELELLEGTLAVRDLPEAWRERYRETVGVAPESDADGVLQDVHWFCGPIGGRFQGYAIGNVLSAQFFDAAVRAHPEIVEEIAQGRFATLHGWLREHVYRYGRILPVPDLIERATGSPMNLEPYLRYLHGKADAVRAASAAD